MLAPLVPRPLADRTPANLPSPTTGDAAEDPFPSPGPNPGRSPQIAAAGLAPSAMLAAAQDMPTMSFAATISPVHAAVALAACAAASIGALSTASLIGYSPARLAQLLDENGHPDAAVLSAEVDRRETEYLVVAALYTAAGWVVGLWALTAAFDEHSLPWALATWIALMLCVAGTLPAVAAETRAERSVLWLLPALRFAWRPLRWPLVLPLLGATHLVVRMLRLRNAQKANAAEVQKQILAAVTDQVATDELADTERTWIANIVALKSRQVSTVMTPRPDIVALPDTLTLREAIETALEHGFSRYPVYHERIDEVVGVFHVKDALRVLHETPDRITTTKVAEAMREPMFVPETTGVAQLLRRAQASNQHMVIVIDEYGTTVGLATVEDLLEEIVGEIDDEYDLEDATEAAEERIRVLEAGRVLEVPARSTVADVNELLGSDLPEDGDYETVAGLVIAHCHHIPTVGEKITVGEVEFEVLEADDRRVQRLRATSIAHEAAEGA
jgi:putative hemolysin